jgi:hypothetical protein
LFQDDDGGDDARQQGFSDDNQSWLKLKDKHDGDDDNDDDNDDDEQLDKNDEGLQDEDLQSDGVEVRKSFAFVFINFSPFSFNKVTMMMDC